MFSIQLHVLENLKLDKMSAQSPNQVDILNLVLADITQIFTESGSLFTLLNDIMVFIEESRRRSETLTGTLYADLT